MLFQEDAKGGIRSRMATFYAAQMVTQDWVQPGGGAHELFKARSDIQNAGGLDIVTAYAVKRPDKCWSVLLINKDPSRSYNLRLRFERGGKDVPKQPGGPWDVVQFSSKEYVWHANGPNGFASRSEPPAHRVVAVEGPGRFLLPPYSLTVVRSSASD